MKMAQAAQDLSSIKLYSFFVESLGAHVIDVKPQVSSVHQRQHQARTSFVSKAYAKLTWHIQINTDSKITQNSS